MFKRKISCNIMIMELINHGLYSIQLYKFSHLVKVLFYCLVSYDLLIFILLILKSFMS